MFTLDALSVSHLLTQSVTGVNCLTHWRISQEKKALYRKFYRIQNICLDFSSLFLQRKVFTIHFVFVHWRFFFCHIADFLSFSCLFHVASGLRHQKFSEDLISMHIYKSKNISKKNPGISNPDPVFLMIENESVFWPLDPIHLNPKLCF